MIQVLLLMFSLSSMAQVPQCYRFQFFGKVSVKDRSFVLSTHSGTRSEKSFSFHHQDIPKLAPYLNKSAKGEFLLTDPDPASGIKVYSLLSIDFAVPDPLQTEIGLKKLDKTHCPKI